MKWAIFSEEATIEVSNDKIIDFEKTLHAQIKVLSNAIPKDHDIKISSFSLELVKREKAQNYDRDFQEFYYDWYHYCFTPISTMQSYRVSRLKYLQQTLKRMVQSYEEAQVHEFCFNFRLFIEVAASYNQDAQKILNLSETVINFKKPPLNGNMDARKNYSKTVTDPDGEFLKHGIIELFSSLGKMVLPTKINLQDKLNGFTNNVSLKPKDGQLGYNLIGDNIRKALVNYEAKIKNLRPFYDLLCGFLHPNSYIFLSTSDDHPSPQYECIVSKKLDDEEETIREFFIRLESHNFIKELIKVTLKNDEMLKKNILDYKKCMKTIVNSTLGLISVGEYQPFKEIASYECLCGSKKKILDCCVRTSKKDFKLLENHYENLINKTRLIN